MALRLIHVGLGNWGRSWARSVVAQNKEIETVAWVEIIDGVMALAKEQLNLPEASCFSTLEDALAKVEADAVLITADLPGHVPNAQAALRAGKHVLLEKPFAPTLREARELVELAEERGLILMISQNYRFASAVAAVTELVREGSLGRVGPVSLDFRRYVNTVPVEADKHYRIWHPLLADMSIHHFDLMRYVLGQEPVEIACTAWNPHWSKYIEPPTGVATITFDGGAVVSYRGSWVSMGPQTNWGGDWRMEFDEGEVVWTSRGEQPESVKVRPLGKRPRSPKLPDYPLHDRAGSLNAFVQSVRTGELPSSSGRDNLKTLALMFAAIESAGANGRPVAIEV
jgi:predicted dehydrogenase